MLEVVRAELENHYTLSGRMKWKMEDIMKLLEISIETYLKTIDGRILFQRDELPIVKSILKPLLGVYVHFVKRNFVFNNNDSLKQFLKFWKRQVDKHFLCLVRDER